MRYKPRAPAKSGHAGYVLIFVLGAVFVLSVIVLGISTNARIDAATIAAGKQALQAEYLLKGALQRVVWGIETGQLSGDLDVASLPVKIPVLPQDIRVFLNRPLSIQIDGQQFRVLLDDGDHLVDPNQLTPEMWLRLGTALGLESENANQLAVNVSRIQEANRVVAGTAHFKNLQDVARIQSLPRDLFYGADRLRRPGVIDLLVFGKSGLRLDINYSPALLYKVVYNATDQQLTKLLDARAKGLLAGQDEQRIFGATVPPRSADDQPHFRNLRITLDFAGVGSKSGMTLLAFVDVTQSVAVVKSATLFYRQ